MLRHMRQVWNALNAERRQQVRAEVEAARERQAEVAGYWDSHRALVREQWASRTGGRGETTVADIPMVAAQWHPYNAVTPEKLSATAQQRGAASPVLWQCPLDLGHAPWPAWPKDRIQKGAGCPTCEKLVKLADIPTLAEQYRGSIAPQAISPGAHDKVPWVCRTWALSPATGRWHQVEHHFEAVVKDRSQQGRGCRVCAGYVIDDTNSLAIWFPELAEQLDDPQVDPRRLSASTHNVSRKAPQRDGSGSDYATYWWRCQFGHRWEATILNRVQGADCRDCSNSGISKEQIRLVAELAWLMDLVDPGRPDPRLPDGVPNFASHKITIPLPFKPAHWRYRDVELDARFCLRSHCLTLGLEYDGVYHHSSKLRDRSTQESEKSEVLVEAGVVAIVVHVRVGALPPIQSPHALTVSVPEQSTPTSKHAQWRPPSKPAIQRASPNSPNTWPAVSRKGRARPTPTFSQRGGSCVRRDRSRNGRHYRGNASSGPPIRMPAACSPPSGTRTGTPNGQPKFSGTIAAPVATPGA